ncbi:hypothetical protein BM536_002730 [Streptomyces phaeoluteigriseus]|uniref:Uncharacterized protein n=1 Tax=Streptomyces phaeoluteigriseus TaxID=114686 RepID=A0A1V6MYD2_9ACTN|nr:hypothetical protein BM536_002730 [Streptomyces phaeoluteigriseus]
MTSAGRRISTPVRVAADIHQKPEAPASSAARARVGAHSSPRPIHDGAQGGGRPSSDDLQRVAEPVQHVVPAPASDPAVRGPGAPARGSPDVLMRSSPVCVP